MARSQHWLDTMARVATMREQESLEALGRNGNLESINRLVENGHGEIARLINSLSRDPTLPQNTWRRLVQQELEKHEAAAIYMKMRRAIWNWGEFAGVSRAAMAIIHVIIELAREEAFPWYVAVPAEHTRKLARMSTRQYVRAIHELDTLAITRQARPVHVADANGLPRFPGTVNEREAPAPIAQWVLRYRHGIPHNKKLAGWWINYDLLCETGRVQRCFIFSPRTLMKTYRSRNRPMGSKPNNWVLDKTDDAMAALEESLSRAGPLPPPGFRAPLWRPAI
jgi:hypothetical protein